MNFPWRKYQFGIYQYSYPFIMTLIKSINERYNKLHLVWLDNCPYCIVLLPLLTFQSWNHYDSMNFSYLFSFGVLLVSFGDIKVRLNFSFSLAAMQHLFGQKWLLWQSFYHEIATSQNGKVFWMTNYVSFQTDAAIFKFFLQNMWHFTPFSWW